MERFNSSVYDWRMGQNGRLKGAVFTFSILFGDCGQAKQTVETFLIDEYGAENVLFFANPHKPTECYAKFDFNRRLAQNEKSND